MSKPPKAAQRFDAKRLRQIAGAAAGDRSRLIAAARDLVNDALAGFVAAVVLTGNIVSFGALMFSGDLSVGISTATWSMLIGSCIGGVWIAWRTSLPPLASGIDSPTGAVLLLLSASAGASALAAGSSPQSAVQSVMLIFTAATLMSGTLLYVLGACRWGSYFRFVPTFVVGGFLAATGWLLIAGGVRMILGQSIGTLTTMTALDTAKLAVSIAAFGLLWTLRYWSRSPFATPATLLAMWLVGAVALRALGLSGEEHGWYFRSLGVMTVWSPFLAARAMELTWPMVLELVPQMLAVTIVALISLVTKVSAIESARRTSSNLDLELRSHGVASLIAAPFGGLMTALQPGSSRLLEHAGSATRMSGVMCALTLGAIGVANINLPGLIPIAIVAGLVFFLGVSFVVDALQRLYAQRAWIDLVLSLGLMVACIQYGYLTGVLVGLVCACVLFAISYARLGAIRRHVTRRQFASYVDRSVEASAYLRENGDAVQVYWLSGYIFFGSSEGVFERIRDNIERHPPRTVAYVILDFAMVSGADASAVVSFGKLCSFCEKRGTTVVYCSLSAANRSSLELGGLFGGRTQHQAFDDFNVALAWCEDRLLATAGLDKEVGLDQFERWLQDQLRMDVTLADIDCYFERKEVKGSQILYRQGEPADSIDLVAVGHLAIDLEKDNGARVRVRRTTTHTVVGEMGFFRRTVRSATVSSEGPVVLFTLTRDSFARMRREHPDLSNAFEDYMLRVLADRIDAANVALAALSR